MLLISFLISIMWAQSPATIATLAKIGDQVVTTRDLQINQFLNEIENPLANFLEKKDPVKEITWEYLIAKESESLMAEGVTSAEVQAYLKAFKRRNENDRLWKSMQVGDKALSESIRRKLVVKKMIALKMPENLVAVDEDSVESYYALNKAQLGNRPLADVHDKIVKGLKDQKMQERFRDWISAITRTHGVVYFSGVKIQ